MRTPNGLFFAPGIRFKDLNVNDANGLADALGERARSWFLAPARCVAPLSPFAAGVIICCFIDAVAEFQGVRIADWVGLALPSCRRVDPRRVKRTIADSFEEDVRHGLVHHARLNRGAEFSVDLDVPIAVVDSVLVVNPLLLVDAIEVAWEMTLAKMRSEADLHRRIAGHIRRVFSVDVEADRAWGASSNADQKRRPAEGG